MDATQMTAAELRETASRMLTDAYTVKPLEWVPYGTGEWSPSSGTGFTVRRQGNVEGKWVLYVGSMCVCGEFDTPHAAKQEAEKMHIVRITTSLTKLDDAAPLAAHILATVHADDDEPISEEWLLSIGCTNYDDGDYLNEHWKVGSGRYEFGIWEFNDTGEWLIKEMDTFGIRTRGQLRQLCKALGIPLPTLLT